MTVAYCMCFDISDVSADVFLKLFGEHFFIFCKQAGYDTMLRTLGGNLIEFIGNLDALHSYLSLSYQVCHYSCLHPKSQKKYSNLKENKQINISNYILCNSNFLLSSCDD